MNKKLIGLLALLVCSCGEDNQLVTKARNAGELCDSINQCKDDFVCSAGICRVVCQSDTDCGKKQHCDDTVCLDNADGSCRIGWSGGACDECARNYFGENCQACPQCGQHGKCNDSIIGNGQCNCDEGWSGTLCNECAANRYGASCTPCQDCGEHGSCVDGVKSDGHCQCVDGWAGEFCDYKLKEETETCDADSECLSGLVCDEYVKQCQTACKTIDDCEPGRFCTDGHCTKCPEGFMGENCDQCLPGRYGENCGECKCQHGDCHDGKNGDGYCEPNSCITGWAGFACDECAAGFYGSECRPVTCKNGIANDGLEGDGHCKGSCLAGFEGEDCERCIDGTIGTMTAYNKEYKTTCINGQYWMAENMAYQTGVTCYANTDEDKDFINHYGCLYTYDDAKDICPSGWHLPAKEELQSLVTTTEANSDSSSIRDSSWESGSNSSGFSALPAGYRGGDGYFHDLRYHTLFWSSTPYGSGSTYTLCVTSVYTDERKNGDNYALSVRCLNNKNSDGSCISRFAGENCDECAAGYFGPNCQPVTCKNGTPNDGITGDGHCKANSCSSPYYGEDCDSCIEGYYGEDCKQYGTMVDAAGKSYKTAEIGGQIWMAENMAYQTGVTCYANTDADEDFINHYGCLYPYDDAQKICPSGWHLPTKEELQSLVTTTEANSDSSSIRDSSWRSGSNSSGFSALPAGCRYYSNGNFDNFGSYAYFWSATPDGSSRAYRLAVNSSGAGVVTNGVTNAFSVRCLSNKNSDGSCISGFAGENCDECAAGYFGPNCQPVTCKNGIANDGFEGDGHCKGSCLAGFEGEDCERCIDGTIGTMTAYNKEYKTTCINGQIWMAENMAYQTGVTCYANTDKDKDFINHYGCLYTYSDAQKICPTGWHLPTEEEFLDLIGATSILANITTTALQDLSWVSDATNSTGFSALPAGKRWRIGSFENFGSSASFWSSTPEDSDLAYYLDVISSSAVVASNSVSLAYSVRCLKDSN